MSKEATPSELLACLAYGLANAPRRLAVARMRDLTVETKRPNRKRPAEATLTLSDDVVKALRGRPELGPEVLVVVLPRDVCDDHETSERRRRAGIVLPGEVGL